LSTSQLVSRASRSSVNLLIFFGSRFHSRVKSLLLKKLFLHPASVLRLGLQGTSLCKISLVHTAVLQDPSFSRSDPWWCHILRGILHHPQQNPSEPYIRACRRQTHDCCKWKKRADLSVKPRSISMKSLMVFTRSCSSGAPQVRWAVQRSLPELLQYHRDLLHPIPTH
jgi:hypothetical protein